MKHFVIWIELIYLAAEQIDMYGLAEA